MFKLEKCLTRKLLSNDEDPHKPPTFLFSFGVFFFGNVPSLSAFSFFRSFLPSLFFSPSSSELLLFFLTFTLFLGGSRLIPASAVQSE